MGARTHTRDRMIDAAKAGFRAHGMVATGFTEVLASSGAARGAIYHHFPGGKDELAAAVVASTANNVEAAIRMLFAASASPVEALADAIDLVATAVEQRQGFGCAIAPAVLEASGNRAILNVAEDAFTRWQTAVREGFEAAADNYAVNEPDSSDIAVLVVASLEGALILSRAAGSSLPVRQVGRALGALLDPAVRRTDRPRRTRQGDE